MPKRDIVVIGASSGGVEALQSLAAQFPPDFPAGSAAISTSAAGPKSSTNGRAST